MKLYKSELGKDRALGGGQRMGFIVESNCGMVWDRNIITLQPNKFDSKVLHERTELKLIYIFLM